MHSSKTASIHVQCGISRWLVRAGCLAFAATAAFSAAGCGDDASSSAAGPGVTSPDAGDAAVPDGGPPDTRSDAGAGTEAGTGGCTTGLKPAADDGVPCGNDTSCDASSLCCMANQGVCRPQADGCVAGDKELGCASSNGLRCKNGTICCLNATSTALASLKTSATCPAQLEFADFSVTQCLSVCNNAKLQVCQADSECQGGTTCHAVLLVEAFAPVTFGVCY